MSNPTPVELVSTRDVAEQLGVSLNTVLRHARRLGIVATYELPGLRGAKLWSPEQVYRLRQSVAETALP